MPDESLLVLLDEVRGRTLRLVRELDEAQARWAPAGLRNSALWHAGHCFILAERLAIRPLGGPTRTPEGWFALFGWGSRPDEVEAGRWPGLADVVARLAGQRRRLRAAIAAATDEQLARPLAGNPGRTVRASIVHALHDEACHGGEIHLLRKLRSAQSQGA